MQPYPWRKPSTFWIQPAGAQSGGIQPPRSPQSTRSSTKRAAVVIPVVMRCIESRANAIQRTAAVMSCTTSCVVSISFGRVSVWCQWTVGIRGGEREEKRQMPQNERRGESSGVLSNGCALHRCSSSTTHLRNTIRGWSILATISPRPSLFFLSELAICLIRYTLLY